MTLKSLLSASALIALGMLAGRVLGLLREMLLASQFGASGTADTAILLLIIPDFVTAAFIGSAASAALIPAFSAREPHAAHALYRQALGITLAAFTALGLLAFAAACAVGWAVPLPALALTLLALPLSAATAILTAWLQYRSRFLVPAFATVIFNGVIILCLLAAPGLTLLAGSIAAASLIRLAAHGVAAFRLPPIPPSGERRWQLDKRLRATYATAMGTGLLGLLPTYVPYALIASAGAGVAVFNYALKLVLMPALLLQTVVQMAVLPWLVAARKNRDAETLAALHAHSLRLAVLAAAIAAASLALCAPALAALCFGHGKMEAADIAIVARSFTAGIAAMPALLAVTLLQSMLYAAGHPRPAFMASLCQAALVLPLAACGNALFHVPGVMASFALGQAVPLFFLLPACRRFALLPAAAFRPARRAALASLAAFIPVAWVVLTKEFSPIVTIACAILAGIVSLFAGAMTYRHDHHHV